MSASETLTPDLQALIDDLDAYLTDRLDVIDGPDGTPLPNEEMNLLRRLRETALHAAEAELGELRRRVAEMADNWYAGEGYETGIPHIDEVTNNRWSAKQECATELRQLLAADGGADGDGQ